MRIALDIDSTLHDYWPGFAAAARGRFGVELPYADQVTWEIGSLRPEQVRALVAETHAAESILAARPYAGAVEVVREWHAAGHEIHVMSHREESCREATDRWLRSVGFAVDALECSSDKVGRCVEVGVGLLVDDSPVNLARALDAGIAVATIAHPWNEELCELEGILSAPDWPTLGERLAPLLAPQAARG
jgi:hypothetical protein